MADTVTAKLAEWEALVEGATEGPWEAVGDEVHAPKMRDQDEATDVATIFDPGADAEFIAAARTAMPALLGFVREVQKLHHITKDSSLTSLDVDPFWRCSCGALDCPTERAARKWIGGEG